MYKSFSINQVEMLYNVDVKQEVEALHRFYLAALTDKQSGQRLYAPALSMRVHKKIDQVQRSLTFKETF